MGLLDMIRGQIRTWLRDGPTGPQHDPRYGESVSYLPCPECGEGSLVYDEDREASVCRACGAVDDGPP
jgi:hypothetical protein